VIKALIPASLVVSVVIALAAPAIWGSPSMGAERGTVAAHDWYQAKLTNAAADERLEGQYQAWLSARAALPPSH
jgi:hypothetical protein